jgi:hypothetical protein
MTIKAKTNNLNKPEDGNYGKQFNYICKDHDVNTCFQPGFFDTLAGNFMAGDTIKCIKIVKERVVTVAEGMIIEVQISGNVRTVEFQPTTKLTTIAGKHCTEEEEKEANGPEYIKENGSVNYNYKLRRWDVMVEGKVVYESDDKQEAQSIARGDLPIPVAA